MDFGSYTNGGLFAFKSATLVISSGYLSNFVRITGMARGKYRNLTGSGRDSAAVATFGRFGAPSVQDYLPGAVRLLSPDGHIPARSGDRIAVSI